MKKIQSILFAAIFLSFSTSFAAGKIQKFSAICTDKTVKAYRYGLDWEDKVIDKWSTGEKFQSGWHFKYTGGNEMFLDGKPFPVTASSGPCLVFSDIGKGPLGVGIWVYAINVKLKKIVAAQVHASHSLSEEVKTRSVSLDCYFDVSAE